MATFKGNISGDIDMYVLNEMICWLRDYCDADITAKFTEVTKEEGQS